MTRGVALALVTFQGLAVLGVLMWATASIIKGYEIFPDKIVVVRLFARKEILSGLIVSVRMDSIGLDKSIRACT